MKKLYLLLIGFSLCLTTAYADNTLSLQNLSIEQGTTAAVLPVSLTNENNITGFQCDLYLPSGVTVATDEYGDYMIAVARTTASRHTISTSLQTDGALRILCTSMTNAAFSGNSGTVLNVTLAVPEDLATGTHDMSLKHIVLSDPDAHRYTSPDVTSSLTVTEAEKITIRAKNLTMVYGDAVPQLAYTSEGAELVGKPVLSCAATSTSAVGTYPITISKGSVENKNVTYVNGTLTIVKAPLTISAGNYTKKQGEENPKFTATYSGFKNGETSAVLTKQPTFTTDVTTSTAPGQYTVKVSGAEAQNYEISYVNGSIAVTEIEIVEKINTLTLQDLSIEQGTTEAVLPISLTNESSITGFQCDLYLPSGVMIATDEYGDYLIAVARTTTSRHTISTSLQTDGALRILCTSMTNATFSGNSGTVLNVTLAVPESMAAGTHDMSLKHIVLSDPDASRHTSPDAAASLTVTEAEKITIRAKNLTMVYGDAVPQLAYTSEGAELVGKPVLSCAATSTSAVGTYPITISKGSVENKNVTYVNGTLTIVKAPLTISAGSYTKKQGDENPKFTATYSGFKNGETSAVLTKQPTFTTDVVASTSPGQYVVKVSGAEAKNYAISYVDGVLVVTERDKVTIVANNITMVYGDEVPQLTYTCADELIGTPQLSCAATSTSPVGTYPITISKGSVENYNVSYVNGTLTIVKAPIRVVVDDCTRAYGEENPVFTVSYDGWVNDEGVEVLTASAKASCIADEATDVGVYDIVVSGAEAMNYSFTYTNGRLTIEKAMQEIVWEQDLSNVIVGDQVELTATATSGLEITYQLANTDIAEIYKANGKSYLDCFNAGQVTIRAMQNGNKNYHAAMRVSKTLVISPLNGIENVVGDDADAPIYNMLGERMNCSRRELQRGVYIQNGRKFVVLGN